MSNEPVVKEFALKEYEALRTEIADAVKESRSLERYAVTVTAAVWAWLLVQPAAEPWVGLVKWIPCAFCFLAGIRSLALLLSIIRIAEYFQIVEKAWGTGSAFFYWEHFIKPKRWYLVATAVVIWATLILGNFCFAWFLETAWFSAIKS